MIVMAYFYIPIADERLIRTTCSEKTVPERYPV